MKSYAYALGILCIVLAGSATSTAQNFHRIPYVVDSLLSSHTISGTIIIASEGKIIYDKAVGFADINKATPMQRSGIFPLGGLSIPLTSYAVTLLKSKGLLEYDSSICTYLPAFPYRAVTVRHLLTHTSGLPGYDERGRFAGTPVMLLDSLHQHPPALLCTPGDAFTYSEMGYQVLEALVEQVSGLSYGAFMQQYIFRPARMFSTSVGQPPRLKQRRLATGHQFDSIQRTFVTVDPEDSITNLSYSSPISASAFDLFLLDRVFKTGKLKTLLEEATTPYTGNSAVLKTRNGKTVRYGFGWSIVNHPQCGKILYHIGILPGYTHYYYRFPDRDLCFIFLSNAETPLNSYLRTRIVDLLSE